MNIGQNVLNLRVKAGKSRRRLAEDVGVTESMIGQIERGTKSLTIALGKEIAAALGCNMVELIKEVDA